MGNWSVYMHTCPDGKVYIGATSQKPRVRWNYGYGYRGSYFYSAIRKYGWNNMLHEVVVSSLTEEQAYALEEELIQKHDATNPDKGYNLSTGRGSKGVSISDETRQRLVNSHLGKKTPHTPEWNHKIGEANKGKSKPHEGVPRSEECRKKIAKVHAKRVYQYDRDMNLIRVYDSVRSAANELNIKNQNICSCCLGKTKTAGGYIWKYYETKETN